MICLHENLTKNSLLHILKFVIKNTLLLFYILVIFFIYSEEVIIKQFSDWLYFIANTSQAGAAVMLGSGSTTLYDHHHAWTPFIAGIISL